MPEKDEIVIWPSNKIRYAYLQSNYYEQCGHLGNSCMRHKKYQKALNFYVKNKVKIAVILSKENKIKARALLWENVHIKTDDSKKDRIIIYLDRCYYSHEEHEKTYHAFAVKNNYRYYKTTLSSIKVKLYIPDIILDGTIYFPYTDTFNILYYKKGLLAASKIFDSKYKYVNLATVREMGYISELDPDRVKEVLTENYISKKDAIFAKKYDGYICNENAVKINNIYYHIQDSNIVCLSPEQYYLKKDTVIDVVTKNRILKKDAIQIKKYGGYINKKEIINIFCIKRPYKWIRAKKKYKYTSSPYHIHDKDVVKYAEGYYIKSQCYYSNIEKRLIPKCHAITIYEIKENKENSNIDIVKADYVSEQNLDIFIHDKKIIKLLTGEYIEVTDNNYRYYIRRNKKIYLKHLYKPKTETEKRQMKLSFTGELI